MTTRPKTLRYREALDAAEQRIVDALPEIIDGLIIRAKEGDAKAAVYLCDRILGKTAGTKTAPADDRQAPYTEADFEEDEQEREDHRDLFAFLKRKEQPAGCKRGTQRGVVQWRSSIATADPTSTDRSGEAVESLRNIWEEARMPCSSTPWKTSIEMRRITREIRNGANGRNSTTWSELSKRWPSKPETLPAKP